MAGAGRCDNCSHDGAEAQVVECHRGQLHPRVLNRLHGIPDSGPSQFAATVFLRNFGPRRAAYVPVTPGAATQPTTRVPATG